MWIGDAGLDAPVKGSVFTGGSGGAGSGRTSRILRGMEEEPASFLSRFVGLVSFVEVDAVSAYKRYLSKSPMWGAGFTYLPSAAFLDR